MATAGSASRVWISVVWASISSRRSSRLMSRPPARAAPLPPAGSCGGSSDPTGAVWPFTLQGLLEGRHRDLDHAVIGRLRRDALKPDARREHPPHEGMVTEPRADPQQLVAHGRDHRDQHDPPRDGDERIARGEQAEQDDADDHEHDQELRAAAGMRRRIAPDRLHRERVLVLEGVDGHVLRAVILEHAPHLGRPAHQQQVAHEEHDADERLGEALEDRLVAAPGRRHARLGQEERQQHEDADRDGEGHEQREGHRAAPQFDALARGRHGAGAHQPSGAHHERVVQQHDPAHERRPGKAVAVEGRGKRLGRPDDHPVGAAEGHPDRVGAAHQDPFHQRLAAVGEGLSHARRSRRRRARQLRAARSSRFWKRSTWPAVSTIVCLPV